MGAEEMQGGSAAELFRPRGGIDTVVSHWGKLLEGVQESPQAFYARIKEQLATREIPGAHLSTVEWPEGGMGSAKRLYLRIERGKDVVDICGAPFGNAFFVSSWLCAPPPSIIAAIAIAAAGIAAAGYLVTHMGLINTMLLVLDVFFVLAVIALGIIRPLFFPPRPTFYRLDTASMFYTAVHQAVTDAVDELTKAKGVRALTAEDKKPIMRFLAA